MRTEGKKVKSWFGSGGIRTHAPEETGALNQRLRPLGHATLGPGFSVHFINYVMILNIWVARIIFVIYVSSHTVLRRGQNYSLFLHMTPTLL